MNENSSYDSICDCYLSSPSSDELCCYCNYDPFNDDSKEETDTCDEPFGMEKLMVMRCQMKKWGLERLELESENRSIKLLLQKFGINVDEGLKQDPLVVHYKAENAKLQEDIDELRGKIKDLTETVTVQGYCGDSQSVSEYFKEKLRFHCEECATERKYFEDRIACLTLQLIEAENDSCCPAFDRIQSKLRDALQDDQNADKAVSQVVEKSINTLVEISRNCDDLKLENIRLSAQLKTMKRLLGEAGVPFESIQTDMDVECDILKLIERVQKCESLVTQMRAQIIEKDNRVNELEKMHVEEKTRAQQLELDLNRTASSQRASVAEIAMMKEILEKKNGKVAILSRDLRTSSCPVPERNELQVEMEKLRNENTAMKSLVKQTKCEVQALTLKNQQLLNDLNNVKCELAKMNCAKQKDKESVNDPGDNCQNELAKLKEINDDLRTSLEDSKLELEKELKAAENQLEILRQERIGDLEKMKNLENNNRTMKYDNEQLHKKVDDLKLQAEKIRQEHDEETPAKLQHTKPDAYKLSEKSEKGNICSELPTKVGKSLKENEKLKALAESSAGHSKKQKDQVKPKCNLQTGRGEAPKENKKLKVLDESSMGIDINQKESVTSKIPTGISEQIERTQTKIKSLHAPAVSSYEKKCGKSKIPTSLSAATGKAQKESDKLQVQPDFSKDDANKDSEKTKAPTNLTETDQTERKNLNVIDEPPTGANNVSKESGKSTAQCDACDALMGAGKYQKRAGKSEESGGLLAMTGNAQNESEKSKATTVTSGGVNSQKENDTLKVQPDCSTEEANKDNAKSKVPTNLIKSDQTERKTLNVPDKLSARADKVSKESDKSAARCNACDALMGVSKYQKRDEKSEELAGDKTESKEEEERKILSDFPTEKGTSSKENDKLNVLDELPVESGISPKHSETSKLPTESIGARGVNKGCDKLKVHSDLPAGVSKAQKESEKRKILFDLPTEPGKAHKGSEKPKLPCGSLARARIIQKEYEKSPTELSGFGKEQQRKLPRPARKLCPDINRANSESEKVDEGIHPSQSISLSIKEGTSATSTIVTVPVKCKTDTTQLESERELLKIKLAKSNDDVQRLNSKLTELQADVSRLKFENEKAKKELDAANLQSKAQKPQANVTKDISKALNIDFDNLKNENVKLSSQIAKLKTERDDYLKEMQRIKNEFSAAQNVNAKMKKELADGAKGKRDSVKINAELKKARNDSIQLKNERDFLKQEFEKSKCDITKLRRESIQLQNYAIELSSSKAKNERLQSEINAIRDKNIKMTEELDRIINENRKLKNEGSSRCGGGADSREVITMYKDECDKYEVRNTFTDPFVIKCRGAMFCSNLNDYSGGTEADKNTIVALSELSQLHDEVCLDTASVIKSNKGSSEKDEQMNLYYECFNKKIADLQVQVSKKREEASKKVFEMQQILRQEQVHLKNISDEIEMQRGRNSAFHKTIKNNTIIKKRGI